MNPNNCETTCSVCDQNQILIVLHQKSIFGCFSSNGFHDVGGENKEAE